MTNLPARFTRGYAVHPAAMRHHDLSDWPSEPLTSKYTISYDTRTVVTVRKLTARRGFLHDLYRKIRVGGDDEDAGSVVIVGRCYDLDDISQNESCIASHIAATFVTRGEQAALQYGLYLSGRFALFIATEQAIIALPDCHATYSICAAEKNGRIVFASHWMLAATLSGLEVSARNQAIMNDPSYATPGRKYYPGVLTSYDDVVPVFANHLGRYRIQNGHFSHERIYPVHALPERDVERASTAFASSFPRSVAASLGERSLIGLTSGVDSQCALRALPRDYREILAFTYMHTTETRLSPETIEDVIGASREALKRGVRHLVIGLEPIANATPFHSAYCRTFGDFEHLPAVAKCLYDNLPLDRTILFLFCPETGTAGYKRNASRRADTPTPELLAATFTRTSNPAVLQAMDDYMAYTHFHADAFTNIHWCDLFYWEHRLTKWGERFLQEVDLTGFAISPYNSRRIIETLLSVPYAARAAKTVQLRFRA